MKMTVQDILTDSLGLINATAIDETPTDSELNVALRAANVMIDRWSSQRLMLRSSTPLTFTLTAGKAAYTVGASGSDITGSKILSVQSGYVTDGDTDYTLDVISKDNYDAMSDKNISVSRPMYVAYDPGSAQQSVQKGTLYFYYTPDKPYPCTIDCDMYLTEFVNLSDNVTFEPAYYEAIIYNLAIRLFRRFHSRDAMIPVDISMIAHESLNNLKAMNSTTIIAACDIPGKVSNYNAYTDTYN